MEIKKVFLDITNLCNANCVYCFTNSNSITKQEMTDEEIIFLINSLFGLGIKQLSIGGGEPFLRNLTKIISEVGKDINISITTNGTILDDEIIECIKNRNVKITISLDSLNSQHMKKVRKGIDLSDVLNNIDKLVKFQDIRKNLSIRSTISTNNITDLKELVDYCESKKIPRLKINSINAFGRGKRCVDIIPEFSEFINILEEIRDYSQNMTLDVELPIEKYLGHGSNICTLGRQSIYIDSTGNVYPCAFSEGSLLFGNVLKHQFDSIKENFRLFNYRNITCENCIIHRYE